MTKVFRPGQSMPNDFETAILERIALAGTLVERIRSRRPREGRVVELLATRHFLRGLG